MVPKIMHDVKRNSKEFQEDRCSTRRVTAAGPRQVKRTTSTLYKIGAPGVTRTPGTQFRKLLLYPPELRGRLLIVNSLPDGRGTRLRRFADRLGRPRPPTVVACRWIPTPRTASGPGSPPAWCHRPTSSG